MDIYLKSNFAFLLLPEHSRLFRYNFGNHKIKWFNFVCSRMVFYRAICPTPHKRTIIKKIKGHSLWCPIFTFDFFIFIALIPEVDSTLLNRLPLSLWINLFSIVYDEHVEESHKKQWERDTLLGFGSDISLANGKKLSLNSAVLRRI
jgi:hypothetical protein